MKLTKQAKKAYIEGVLSHEVEAPNFAEQIEAAWQEITVLLMPVAVAAVYRNPATRDWVSAEKVQVTRQRIRERDRRADGGFTDKINAQLSKIDEVEQLRDKHQYNVDNIRKAITTAADSVTTVEGLRRILPQYAKYLPDCGLRPTASDAAKALRGLNETIQTANIIAGTSRAPGKKRAARKPRSRAAMKVV